jgi:hypothetical protein
MKQVEGFVWPAGGWGCKQIERYNILIIAHDVLKKLGTRYLSNEI